MIPRIPLSEIPCGRFVEEFMMPNMPVIITGLVDAWPVSAEVFHPLDAKHSARQSHTHSTYMQSDVATTSNLISGETGLGQG